MLAIRTIEACGFQMLVDLRSSKGPVNEEYFLAYGQESCHQWNISLGGEKSEMMTAWQE